MNSGICQPAWLIAVLLLPTAAGGQAPETVNPVTRPLQSSLFRHQYTIYDEEFCQAETCVDYDGDGRLELVYATRGTGILRLLDAATGEVNWSHPVPGEQQSLSAFDVDGDGQFEILYSVSDPGDLHLVSPQGDILRTYSSGDHKLGNSPVVIDADGDGTLEGYFGTRNRYMVRLNLVDFSQATKRDGWVQCGCYTTAMDVDHDGKWDLFAGSGDDSSAKGVLHRLDPLTLQSTWTFTTNDNASSADAVLVDIDADGEVEIIKSVDNYAHDDAHDAVYAFETDGAVLWKVEGLSGEDSPNVADLDGDGDMEIVGMTFGGEVYCLDPLGHTQWRRDLRPDLDDGQHMYMAPILCDLNGDAQLEILAMTHGQYAPEPGVKPSARVSALNAQGEVLDELDLGEPRYWGHALVCQIDDDPFIELVVSGSGGVDVIETRGLGPWMEHFQRRRNYQRLNVVPWAYEDSYFHYRGLKQAVTTRTDNLVLKRTSAGYASHGEFVTEELRLPPDCQFTTLRYDTRQPPGTEITVSVLNSSQEPLLHHVCSGTHLGFREPLSLRFEFSTNDVRLTPELDFYSLGFDRIPE